MNKYYYLMAQLPSVSYQSPLPMASKAFFELCAAQLAADDLALLASCSLASRSVPTGSRVLTAWAEWEGSLRVTLARLRAQKLGREAELAGLPTPTPIPEADALARVAMASESPLEAEFLLDRGRWAAIEGFRGLDAFDREAVFAYQLQLLLIERRDRLQSTSGYAAYQAAYRQVLDDHEQQSDTGVPA